MKIQVGNSLNTKFWEDVWMGIKNFKISFPRIYALESDKNLTVADKMAHNDTAFSLRRQPRDGVEMEQFRALSIVIEDHLDVESYIIGNHIVHSFEKGVLGIDYDSMVAMGMWFHSMAVMDIGYNFRNCDHRIDLGGRKRVDHLFEIVDHFAYELSLDIDDSDLHLTPVLRPSGSTHFEPTPLTPNTVRIIPGPAGTVQQAMPNGVTGYLGDIENFLKKGKLDQVVAIVKSYSPNVLGDLTVTMKDLFGIITGTVHHKVIGEGGYGRDIIVGAALILANVLVFSSKPSMHYLNITMRNVVKVFRKDTISGSDSG
nr:hypothetical protein [Tanacetum cinerariifolium]